MFGIFKIIFKGVFCAIAIFMSIFVNGDFSKDNIINVYNSVIQSFDIVELTSF